MSVVVAIKENDTIYLGADTLMARKNTKVPEINNIEKFKLTNLPNGIILGHVGGVSTTQKLVLNEEWFIGVEEKGLDKEFLVTVILPKLKEELEKYKLLDEDGMMDADFLIAYKDRLYDIKSDFSVVKINEHTAIGAGKNFALSISCKDYVDKQEKLIEALRHSSKMCSSVDGPFVLIDTKTLEFAIKN